MPDFDERWDWVDVTPLDKPPGTVFIKGRCRHLEVVPVESAGERVAQLCLTCDAQLPPGTREPVWPPGSVVDPAGAGCTHAGRAACNWQGHHV